MASIADGQLVSILLPYQMRICMISSHERLKTIGSPPAFSSHLKIIPFLEHGSLPRFRIKAEAYYCSSSRQAANLVDSGRMLIINNEKQFDLASDC